MTFASAALGVKVIMKDDDDCPLNPQDHHDDLNDEEDPNVYGEQQLSLGRDEQNNINTSFHRMCSPVTPSAQIKPEPEEMTIKREQSPTVQLFDDNIPLLTGDGFNENPSREVQDYLQTMEPRKRRRLIPEVLLYTWNDLQKRRQKDFEKIKNMNNPVVKKAKNVEFSLSSLYDRLKDGGLLDPFQVSLEPEIRDQPVSRAFMSSVYGGGQQDTFPNIGQARYEEHGMKYFMYVNAFRHTHAPQWPGNSGLFFRSEVNWFEDGASNVINKTFVRLDSAKWMYIGDYSLLDVPPLSKEEWSSMTAQVRNAWVRYFLKKGWATNFRARIVARKALGRKPTVIEWQRVREEGRANQVTPEEIHAALEAGHEQLGISGMKCVGYDEAFQRQLVERFSQWAPPAPRPRGERRARRDGTDVKPEPDSESKPLMKQEIKAESESKHQIKHEIKAESKSPKKSRKRKREATPESDAELSPGFGDSGVGNLLQDGNSKKKLRRKSVVKKQENVEFWGLTDNGSEDGDWQPEIEPSGGSQVQTQALPPATTTGRQWCGGTRADPIII